jgi:uncharacterized protein (TIGR02444 family)
MNLEHDLSTPSVDQLWQFSLSYYGVPGVKEACLSLQNHFGGNVNTLLLLKYLDLQRISISAEQLEELIGVTAQSDTLILQYRNLRKSLKASLPDTLYRDALAFELKLEQQQQQELVQALQRVTPIATNAPNLVATYCQQRQAPHLIAAFIEPAQQ